jgi:hypothetical protein
MILECGFADVFRLMVCGKCFDALQLMPHTRCNLSYSISSVYVMQLFYRMKVVQCHLCVAIYAMRSMQCKLCHAIYAVLALLCNLCDAIGEGGWLLFGKLNGCAVRGAINTCEIKNMLAKLMGGYLGNEPSDHHK